MPKGIILSIAFISALIAVVLLSSGLLEGLGEESPEEMTDAVGSNPDRHASNEELIRIETLLNELITGQKRLERLLAVRQEGRVPVRPQEVVQTALSAQEYADFGSFCAESGKVNEAAGYYRKSLESAPSIGVMFAYAESLYRSDPHLRNDSEIVLSLLEVLKGQPFHEGALKLLGAVSLENGDVQAATEAYASLYELHPQDRETASIYGRLLVRQERFAEAVEPLAVASRLAANSNIEDPSLPCDLGTCLAAAGRHQAAVEAYADAIRLDAFFPPAHLGMAESLLAMGLGEDAARSAASYRDLRENDYRGALVEGDAYAAAGEAIKAEMAWTSALETLELNSREDVDRYLEASLRLAGSLMDRGRSRAALARSVDALEYSEAPELLEIAGRASEDLGDADAAEGYAKRLEEAKAVASEEEADS